MKNDYDFIKDKFDNDNIKAPDNINEENVIELIKGKEPKRIKLVNTKAFKAIVSAAACLVVVLLAFGVMQPQLADDKVPEKTANNNSASAITAFSDYKEIKAYIKSSFNNADEYANYGAGIKGAYGIATEETADGVSVDTLSENISYADTYKQVDSVDEADIIKTDGKYIYYIDDFDNTIGIYKADKSATMICAIDDFENENDTDTQYFGLDMFLYGNSLIVTCEEANYEDGDYENYVGTYVYDISNPKKPKLTKTYKQSGCYVSSRMIGERLYVVSNKYVYPRCKNIKEYIPYGMSENGVLEPLSAKDICCINNSSEPNYIVVSSIDVENEDKQTETKAILGAGEQIYCNEKNMYVAGASYEYLENNNEISDVAFYNSTTRLVKISLENGIEFTAEGKINGNLNNQFSMDEKDGYLRVATTSNDKNGNEINNLYVLDSDLKKVGEVTGFAKDESIRAVKFLGDTAYVITYEQTDPLFVIDLSDPKAPEIKGSVKISGFSTMLMPVDENTILGIGYSDEEREDGIVTNGLKLALFDISDSAKPRVLDSKEFIGYESQVQYNHKALVINKEQGYYAIPYAEYNSEASAKAGILTFEITDREINMTENFKTLNSGYTCPRCTYVNDTLYLFNGYEDVTAFIK